jgi:hypothetical protein
MPKQVTFTPRVVPLREIAAYHEDADFSLRLFFTSSNPNFFLRFIGKSRSEIVAELADRLFETDIPIAAIELGDQVLTLGTQDECVFKEDGKPRSRNGTSLPVLQFCAYPSDAQDDTRYGRWRN